MDKHCVRFNCENIVLIVLTYILITNLNFRAYDYIMNNS